MKHIGMYIHIPFCKKKCDYCDFESYDNKADRIPEYMQYLKQELQEVGEGIKLDYQAGINDGVIVDTIYIGGGTPSFVDSKYIVEMLDIIRKYYMLNNNTEITIEVNPGTVNKERLEAYIKAGIHRCSIGLQSSNDMLLECLGRIHRLLDFQEAYNLAREVGFKILI